MDFVQSNILRNNHRFICNNVDLKSTDVLDRLREVSAISSDEAEEILNYGAKREQTSHLLFFLKKKDPSRKPFQTLVDVLKPCHADISDKLSKDLSIAQSRSYKYPVGSNVMCTYCFLLKNLVPTDIAHTLYENMAFTDDELEEINNPKRLRRERVKLLLKYVSRYDQDERISDMFTNLLREEFKCELNSQSICGMNEMCSCHCKQKMENLSKDKIPVEHSEKPGDGQVAGMLPLVKEIPKSLPNNTKLLRTIRKLWNEFWFLREQGEWAKLKSRTEKTFIEYRENFDIQVFLLRSEMCTYTFYKEDNQKAEEMFSKAKTLLSRTSMPNWHLGRLFALRIYMCMQTGKLEEAQRLISEGKQELGHLSPCLATGTLLFFEALYYSNLLRLHCRGDIASKIFERAKKSFLTSFDHYGEEHLFAVDTWRDEVYLFLPLLEMHVDFKKLNEIDIQRPKKMGFILVEHYLNLFENKHWRRATPWSKMLYNIARAKQHERQGNLERSLDYYRTAKDFAEGKDFTYQTAAIQSCIDKLEERNDVLHLQFNNTQFDQLMSSDNSVESYGHSGTDSVEI